MIPIVLIAVAVLAMNPNILQSYSGAIQSVSNIQFDDGIKYWVGTFTINESYEKVSFVANGTTEGDAKATSKIDLSFRQLTPNCYYPMTYKEKKFTILGFPLTSVPYVQLGLPTMNVPYNVAVYKNSLTATETKDIDVGALGGATTTLAGGQVKIQNLGQLSGGIRCPAGAALVPQYTNNQFAGYKIVDNAAFNTWYNRIDNAIISAATNPLNFAGNILVLWQALQQQVDAPPEFFSLYSAIGKDPAGVEKYVVSLPKTAAFANISVEVSSAYADTVIYSPPKPKPTITISLSPTTIDRTKQIDITATVKNIGTAGTIQVLPTSTTSVFSFNPVSNQEEFAANQTRTFTFKGYALKAGADSICIRALGVQSGEQAMACAGAVSTEITTPLPPIFPQPVTPVEPTPITPTPQPEPIPEPIPVPIGGTDCSVLPYDGLWTLGYVNKNISIPQYLFGFIPIEIGTTTETQCVPVYNLALVGIIAIVAIAGIVVLVIWKKPFGKKGRKRR